LQRLLSGWVLLDACSAEIIINRGLGHLIGIKSAAWHSLNDLGYAYEEINEADPAIYGLAKPRMSAQRCSQRLWRMEINEDAKAWTTICSYDRQPLCPGLAEFTNALGGIVRTLAYPLGEGQFFVGFFNNFRRILWQRFLETSAQPLAMGRQGPLQVYRVRHAQGVLLAILNPSHDDLKTVEFFASEVNFDTAQGLATDGTWQAVELQKIAANIARYPQPLEALEVLILNFPSLNDQEY